MLKSNLNNSNRSSSRRSQLRPPSQQNLNSSGIQTRRGKQEEGELDEMRQPVVEKTQSGDAEKYDQIT